MNVTKTTKRTYQVEFLGFRYGLTVGRFKKFRVERKQSTSLFERCFICGKVLDDTLDPFLISVQGKGNLFACDDCKEKHSKAEGGTQ